MEESWTVARFTMCFLIGAGANAANLYAQDSAVIRGTVVDRSTGKPVAEVRVGVFPGGPKTWAITDTLGRFTVRPVAPGSRRVFVECPRARTWWADTVSVHVAPGSDQTLALTVGTPICTRPPNESRELVLTGAYETGFESFGFLPDADSLGRPVVWGGTYSGLGLPVEFTQAVADQHFVWPKIPASNGYYCYAVRWRGTLRGPLGASGVIMIPGEYLWRVDSILAVTAADPSRCPSARPRSNERRAQPQLGVALP